MNVYYEVRDRIAVVQIDNPPVNGLGHAVREGIAVGVERALDDPAVQAIVITGTGRVFSGGADIREFNTPAMLAPPTLLDLIATVEQSFKPVISAINGVCMGGGLELSLACHYRLATPRATMGLPESKIGLIPGAGGTQRLPRAVGAALALRMITSGEPIRADHARDAGLVSRVVPESSFDGVLAFAHEVAAARPLPRLRDRAVALPEGVTAAAFFTAARQQVEKAARGLTAPLRCVSRVWPTSERSSSSACNRPSRRPCVMSSSPSGRRRVLPMCPMARPRATSRPWAWWASARWAAGSRWRCLARAFQSVWSKRRPPR
jgi:3-hydroxyacyl-CoA dehydrogenase